MERGEGVSEEEKGKEQNGNGNSKDVEDVVVCRLIIRTLFFHGMEREGMKEKSKVIKNIKDVEYVDVHMQRYINGILEIFR